MDAVGRPLDHVLCAFLVAFGAQGCSSTDLRPDWYVHPSTFAASTAMLVGRGACPDPGAGGGPSCAVESARADLASALRTHARTHIRLRCERRTLARKQNAQVTRTGRVACALEREADLTPIALELENVTAREGSCPGDGYCYALVVTSRAALGVQIRAGMAERVKALEALLRSAEQATPLVAPATLAHAADIARSLGAEATLLAAITRGRDPWLSLLQRPAQRRAAWAARTAVCVRPAPPDAGAAELVSVLLDTLARAGLRQVAAQGAAGCPKGSLVVAVDQVEPETRLVPPVDSNAPFWTAARAAALILVDTSSATEQRFDISGHGVGTTPERSRTAAEQDLRERLEAVLRTVVGGV